MLLLGHGASAPGAGSILAKQARRVRDGASFADVKWAVFVGEPTVTSVLGEMTCRSIHVVPYFMSGGGFAAMCADVCREADRDFPSRRNFVHHPPVGLEPGVTDLIQSEALRSAGQADINPEDATLLLVAHGSSKRAASRQAALLHVERMSSTTRFRDVRAVFLEESPTLAEVLRRHRGPAVVVGLLAGGGHHAERDIPQALSEGRGPVVFTGCIGEHPVMARIVVDRVTLRRPADAA